MKTIGIDDLNLSDESRRTVLDKTDHIAHSLETIMNTLAVSLNDFRDQFNTAYDEVVDILNKSGCIADDGGTQIPAFFTECSMMLRVLHAAHCVLRPVDDASEVAERLPHILSLQLSLQTLMQFRTDFHNDPKVKVEQLLDRHIRKANKNETEAPKDATD